MKKWLEENNIDCIFIVSVIVIGCVILGIAYSVYCDMTHECIESKIVNETRCNTSGGSTYCWQDESEVCIKYAK